MTIFEVIRIALDQLYQEGTELYGAKLDERITSDLAYLSNSYRQLTDSTRAPVDYEDPARRFAYVYKYVAAHGDYLVQVLQALASKKGAMFNERNVRVSCLGGGPGSDIVGLLKYLDEQEDEPVKKLTCYLLDKEQAWADIWTELDEHLTPKVAVNVNFQPFDITNPGSWTHQRKFLQADLFTMSYFVSEVMMLDGNGVVANSWRNIFDSAKNDAFFVYVDNGHKDFTSYFDKQWQDAKLKCISSGEDERWTPRYSEQASELEEYRRKFGQYPKLKSQLTYRVLKKT